MIGVWGQKGWDLLSPLPSRHNGKLSQRSVFLPTVARDHPLVAASCTGAFLSTQPGSGCHSRYADGDTRPKRGASQRGGPGHCNRAKAVNCRAPPTRQPVAPASSPAAPLTAARFPAGLLAPEAQLVVTIGNVGGVLDSSVLDPEPGPQGPIITYSYYVTYDFVEDEDSEREEYPEVLAEVRARGGPENRGGALRRRGTSGRGSPGTA